MSVKVIVELQARGGMRDALVKAMQDLVAAHGAAVPGYLGSERFEVPENPDMVVEIAEWESVERRTAHMQEAAASGVYGPIAALLAAPFRATVIRRLG